MAHQPSKYDRQYDFSVQQGIRCVLRFDKTDGSVTRFVVQLQRLVDVFDDHWETFAQVDHEPNNPKGHDLYAEGLHVDIYHIDGTTSTIHPVPTQSALPRPPVTLLHGCKNYLTSNATYFLQAAGNRIPLSSPPRYS